MRVSISVAVEGPGAVGSGGVNAVLQWLTVQHQGLWPLPLFTGSSQASWLFSPAYFPVSGPSFIHGFPQGDTKRRTQRVRLGFTFATYFSSPFLSIRTYLTDLEVA